MRCWAAPTARYAHPRAGSADGFVFGIRFRLNSCPISARHRVKCEFVLSRQCVFRPGSGKLPVRDSAGICDIGTRSSMISPLSDMLIVVRATIASSGGPDDFLESWNVFAFWSNLDHSSIAFQSMPAFLLAASSCPVLSESHFRLEINHNPLL